MFIQWWSSGKLGCNNYIIHHNFQMLLSQVLLTIILQILENLGNCSHGHKSSKQQQQFLTPSKFEGNMPELTPDWGIKVILSQQN